MASHWPRAAVGREDGAIKINRTYALAAPPGWSSSWSGVLVWAVISRVGEGVITQPGGSIGRPRPSPRRLPSSAPTGRFLPSREAGSLPGLRPPRRAGPSRSRRSRARHRHAQLQLGAAGTDPSSGAGFGPGPGPGPSRSASFASPKTRRRPPPRLRRSRRRTRGTTHLAGERRIVTCECRGGSISLKGAEPNSGWSIEVERRGPEEVRVDFESNDVDRRTRVQSECVAGTEVRRRRGRSPGPRARPRRPR